MSSNGRRLMEALGKWSIYLEVCLVGMNRESVSRRNVVAVRVSRILFAPPVVYCTSLKSSSRAMREPEQRLHCRGRILWLPLREASITNTKP